MVHRFAVATCIVALLPISVGALVTTLRAGMAFSDWPTSDGHNMLLYPWLNDLRNSDRFAEHGHRLAGVVIGLTSIGLLVVTFLRERRRWVRGYTVTILIAVIAQGMLGGARVLMDANVMAMVHSITGALFFTQCVAFAMLTARGAADAEPGRIHLSGTIRAIVILLPVIVLGQYLLGGMFRHLGRMMYEHLAGAAMVALWGIVAVVCLLRTKQPQLSRAGIWIAAALLLQLGLGASAWVTKLNVPALGWVVSTGSPAAVVFRSLHTVGGMFLLAATTLSAVQVVRQPGWFDNPGRLLTDVGAAKGGLA